jgi:hypothetical protein
MMLCVLDSEKVPENAPGFGIGFVPGGSGKIAISFMSF